MTMKKSKIDTLINELDKSLITVLDNWKLSTDMKAKPSQISKLDYDDSKWRNFKLNEEDVFQNGCWLRKVITIPKKIGGKNVTGKLNISISINDLGKLWINGKYKTSWQWDKTILLSKITKPGNKFVILIKAYSNHPMYLFWLSNAFLILEESKKVKNITDNLLLSLKTTQKLLSNDTYQKNGFLSSDPKTDKSTLNKSNKKKLYQDLQRLTYKINIAALKKGDYNEYLVSVNQVKKKLKVFDKFAKKFTLYFLSNAHIDAEWLWRETEAIEVCNRTFSSTLKLMDKKEDLTFIQSSAAYYEWMEKKHPKIFSKIQNKVNQGQWEIVGGMWVEPDCNLPSGEAWTKQFFYAQKYFKSKFGKKVKVGFNPDSFGYNWNLPQFLVNAGIDTFVTQKINWNDTNIFPHRLFWWESPDGSRVLTYFPTDYMNKIDNPFEMIDFIRQFEANTGFKEVLFFFGIGDHGGGPSWKMLKRIDNLKKTWVFPKIEFTTLENYFNIIKKNDISNIPVWKDELYMEFHRATYTTQAKTKKWNRDSETLLSNADKLSVFANIYEQSKLEKAWKNILFNQFHDILPGTSIPSVLPDVYEKYEKVDQLGKYVLNKSFVKISKSINTNALPEGKPIVLFNTLSWERTEIVKYKLVEGDNNLYGIFDETGIEIPSQINKLDELSNEILFKAKVPEMGYKVYGIKKQDHTKFRTTFKNKNNIIQNKYFKIEIDKQNGWIKQITDKQNNKNILSDYGNKLEMFGNKVPLWKAWNINYTGEKFNINFVGGKLVEQGSIRTIYRLKYNFLKPGVRKPYPTEDFPTSFFTQDIILYNDLDVIDFKTEVNWWEDEIILKVLFPLNIKGYNATYEIPYGSIHRSSDLSKKRNKGKFEVPSIRWADLSDENYGVSLINNSKYGYSIINNEMSLTLLNAPLWPDPNANRGKNIITYRLYPHNGNLQKVKTIMKGYEFNNPILSFDTDRHNGKLKLSNSFVKISPVNVILTTIKYAEGKKNVWMLQFFETDGKETKAKLQFNNKPKKVTSSNFLEEDIGQISFENNTLKINVKANEVKTLKIYY